MLKRHINRRVFSSSIVLSALAAGTAQAAGAVVGQAAPDFTGTDALGKTHKLSDFRGKHVVLEWTNPNCPFVVKHYGGNMQALQAEFTRKGVVWLSVNSTNKKSAMLMDDSGDIGQLYSAKTTPHMYIISPQGVLIYAGAIDSVASANTEDVKTATNYVRQGLNEALGGKAISVAATRPYGCFIKYKD